MFDAWGTESNQAGLIITQLSGALEIGLGLILWLSRNEGVSKARRAIVLGGFITYSLFFIIMLINISGVSSAAVWANIVLYLLLALGFGFFAFLKKS
jgi:apolipoprotein N-acyltransferase